MTIKSKIFIHAGPGGGGYQAEESIGKDATQICGCDAGRRIAAVEKYHLFRKGGLRPGIEISDHNTEHLELQCPSLSLKT
jgi:hypothetical protein